jgi:hypothetical protein
VLGDLSAVLALLPGVTVTGGARDEVFLRAHIRTDAGPTEFCGVARRLALDNSRHLMRFDVRSLQMPETEPLASVSVRAEAAGRNTAVKVEADKAETEDTDVSEVSEHWAETMTHVRAALHVQLAEGTRHSLSELPNIAQVMARHGANGVVRLFLSGLGLATGRPYLPRGPVKLYGEPPQDPPAG